MKKKSKGSKEGKDPSKKISEDEEIGLLLERINNEDVKCGSQPVQ